VPGDLGETGVKRLRRNTGKPLGMRAEGRELEAGRASLDHVGDIGGTVIRVNGAIEGEIHARLLACLARLLRKALPGADQQTVVVGHVHDGGDAARRRRSRRPHEVLLAALRPGMHLGVDGAGEHEGGAEILPFARCGGCAFADAFDQAAADRDVSGLADPVGAHNAAGHDQIEIAHVQRLRFTRPRNQISG
jgi:hypothetical protein